MTTSNFSSHIVVGVWFQITLFIDSKSGKKEMCVTCVRNNLPSLLLIHKHTHTHTHTEWLHNPKFDINY